jgi:hypothetical protein
MIMGHSGLFVIALLYVIMWSGYFLFTLAVLFLVTGVLILLSFWSVPLNPFQSSCLEKFPHPGHEGILNPDRATKHAVLLEKLVQQGHKVKNISETVSLCILSPRVLSLFFDGPIAFFSGIVSHMHHPKYLEKTNSRHYITKKYYLCYPLTRPTVFM